MLEILYEAGFGSPLRFGLRHPARLAHRWSSLRRDPAEFARRFDVALPTLRGWLGQLESFRPAVLRAFSRTGLPLDRANFGSRNILLYLFVRRFRPSHVVETGVEYGFSTAHLLQGLQDNGSGDLVSIDLPTTDPRGHLSDGRWDGAYVKAVGLTGAAIPEELRSRWELVLGDSRDLLPKVLERRPVDAFFHDSDHAAAAMTREYRACWDHLVAGGLLLSDDINLNTAFGEFCTENARTPFRWADGRRGAIQK
ncbi:MAG TPA: class I SAM-dependent methyltransferase [Thermoplasmata archaeon]|nr:class I SAM-dependent methyltransferase [Thermoplasmata archaeon]